MIRLAIVHSYLTLLALCITLHLSASPAYAQSGFLLEHSAPIAFHTRKPTRIKFSVSSKSPMSTGKLYRLSIEERIKRAQERAKVVPCVGSDVWRVKLKSLPWYSRMEDIVFYSPDDRYQASKAKTWPMRAVPYQTSDSFSSNLDPNWQAIADQAGIHCLPTRTHYITDNNTHYLEYREGDRAWDPPPTISSRATVTPPLAPTP